MGTMRGRRVSRYGRRGGKKGWGSGIFGGMAVRGESMSFLLLWGGLAFGARVADVGGCYASVRGY